MIATIIMGISAILFAYLSQYKHFENGLKISFSIICLFLALRYNFGNDYAAYLNRFIEINNYTNFDFFDKTIHVEPGWIILCRIFEPFGFFAMIATLALVNCIVYYRFIKKYVAVENYWLAVFLYLFNPAFMLTHASAMRQSLAIAIFIFSLDYLYNKDLIRYFLCIGTAWFFHTSAAILFPIFLIGFFNWNINKAGIAVFISIFLSLFIFSQSIMPYMNQLISMYFDQYEIYENAGFVSSGVGVLMISSFFILLLHFERFQTKQVALVFKVAVIGFIFIPLSLLIQILGRMGMYFEIVTIIVYPVVYASFKRVELRKVFVSSLVFLTIFSFVQFFQNPTYRDAFSTYKTIFSAPKLY